MDPAVRFDPYDHATQDDPFPVFRALRETRPVYRDPDDRFWALSRYDDVKSALLDHGVFSNEGGIILGQDMLEGAPPSMVTMDPPRHTTLRKLVNRAFTPSRIAAYEDRLRASVDEFVDEFVGNDGVDLVPMFAKKVPVRAISDIVGVPASERERFQEWADVLLTDPTTPEAMTSLLYCVQYFLGELEDRRTRPREDLLTGIVEAEVDGERLATEEQVGMILLLFLAGIETTQFHFSNTLYHLATDVDLQKRLRADPALIPAASEEILRFDAPVLGDIRTLKRDVTLHGVTMPEGATVLALFGSGNRDPEVFDDPDVIDLERANVGAHLSFAHGVHFCLGAPLVRLESRVGLEQLFERLPIFSADPDACRRVHTNGPFMRGLASVPVTFD